jgi:hypothetical protein
MSGLGDQFIWFRDFYTSDFTSFWSEMRFWGAQVPVALHVLSSWLLPMRSARAGKSLPPGPFYQATVTLGLRFVLALRSGIDM